MLTDTSFKVGKTWFHYCEVCGKQFACAREQARTCSTACRTAKSRGIRSGQGRGWYAVRKEYVTMLEEIYAVRYNSDTYNSLSAIMSNCGAGAVEYAIVAIYAAMGLEKTPEESF